MIILRELLETAIFIAVLAVLFIIFSTICIIGIAWTHHPRGIRRKRKKEDEA